MLRATLLLASAVLWADPRCAECHQSIAESYARTGKARSIGKPRAEIQAQRQWFHEFSGRRMGSIWQNGKLTQWMEVKGNVESYEPEWAIGSGRDAKIFAHRIADKFFLSPLAWYASRLLWDMAPGQVIDANPTFYRPLPNDCLQCHSASPESAAPLTCDSCHGDPTAHLAAPKRGNIINAAKLPAPRRDAVCDSCHLYGEARINNPGKSLATYRPGQLLEDSLTIYVARRNSPDTILRAPSQAEQMAESRCATESKGRLWCGSCHDSHSTPTEKQRLVYYRDKCLNCHETPAAEAHRRKAGDDCVRCHMPRLKPFDGSHASHTDHWIRTARSEEKFIDRGEYLRAWREPPAQFATRNLALAYLSNADRTRSLKRLREGLRLLNETVAAGQRDGDVAYAAGLEYLRQKQAERAIPWLERAVEAEPANAMRRLQLAAALANAGKADDARRQALEAVRLEPLLEQSYGLLAQIEPERAAHWRDEYRKLVPKRNFP